MRYEQPPAMSRSELENVFRGNSGEKSFDALISATYSEDAGWLLDWCLKLIGDERSAVRYGVALALGQIAICDHSIDLTKCLGAVEKLTCDAAEPVRVAALDSLDDVLLAIQLWKASQT